MRPANRPPPRAGPGGWGWSGSTACCPSPNAWPTAIWSSPGSSPPPPWPTSGRGSAGASGDRACSPEGQEAQSPSPAPMLAEGQDFLSLICGRADSQGLSMIERQLDIPTKDGATTTFIVHPERGGPHPVILFFMDAPAIREELRDMARRLATSGYYVMLPNLYYRSGVMELGPLSPDPADPGRARVVERM